MILREQLLRRRMQRRALWPGPRAWLLAAAGHAVLAAVAAGSRFAGAPPSESVLAAAWRPQQEVPAVPEEATEAPEPSLEPEVAEPVPEDPFDFPEPEPAPLVPPRPRAAPEPPPPEPEPSSAWLRPIRRPRPVAEPAKVAPARARVDPSPIPGQNPPPHYPRLARRYGWQGRVVLLVEVGGDGRVRSLRIVRSSGYPVLDRAAVRAVAAWRFRDGPGRVEVPVVFALEDR